MATTSRWLATKRTVWSPIWRLEILVVFSLSWQRLLDANHLLSSAFYFYHLVAPCKVCRLCSTFVISCNNVSPSNLLRVIAILWYTIIFTDSSACTDLIGLCHQLQARIIFQTIVVTPILHRLHQQIQVNSSIIDETPLHSSFSRMKHEIHSQS